ncbi:4Fe-4S dicluster domain-containing protein [Desulfofundulus thermobenzoicus]|uniref:4Fe-4S dicluster domain-containing protein n=1 Tax=Desulfofundulus thermobenzoicus TaxID=29376 RepID=A0A6N7IRI1_9FIRM|nr:4Fe-4S dicluster domain-containing protein [Desulfofundulus thermobenzoicus]MQL52521.1 4Fe-4S dicluster domain-containing protein [Desulfofundulus thermobenzoicus]HHW43935.1 4Fe-4S dicluster domain-containing protein [Desulfotomaculum sp.]
MKRIFIRPELCAGCKTCELTCMVEHCPGSSLWTINLSDPANQPRNVVLAGPAGNPVPLACRHCTDAPCLTACPAGALVRDEAAGTVIHQPERCAGCWMCVMACPYGLIWPDARGRVAVKCDFCGERNTPRCVEACPTGALSLVETDGPGVIREITGT